MSEPGVIYTATDATETTAPEPGMIRQVLAWSPHLMLVRHTFEEGWKGARHSHPHHQLVYVVRAELCRISRLSVFLFPRSLFSGP